MRMALGRARCGKMQAICRIMDRSLKGKCKDDPGLVVRLLVSDVGKLFEFVPMLVQELTWELGIYVQHKKQIDYSVLRAYVIALITRRCIPLDIRLKHLA